MNTQAASIHSVAASLLLVGAYAFTAQAHDWPRWLGPNGDNIAPLEGSLVAKLDTWKVAWKAEVGQGYSSVIVSDNRAFTLGHDGQSKETVYCFEAASGQLRWKFAYDAQLLPRMHPGGPNASATIHGDHVLTVSKDGQVHCLTADQGSVVWKINLTEVMGIKVPSWGFASSPVISHGRLLLSAGKVAALDPQSGKTLWLSATEHLPGYTTPVPFQLAGEDYIAALDGKGLSILAAKDGSEIARHPFQAQFDMVATTPVVLEEGRRIFISSNLNAEMVAFDGRQLTQVWTSRDLRNTMNNSVLMGGVLYGVDGRQGSKNARLVSVNVQDGKVNWARDEFGYGTTIGVGKSLLALTEQGELVLVQPAPEGYLETSRRPILDKTCWTNPVFADNRIFVRNDQGAVICLAAP